MYSKSKHLKLPNDNIDCELFTYAKIIVKLLANLVDPASSHMLVSKIKPCMCVLNFNITKPRIAH